jgi:hypothetical protein
MGGGQILRTAWRLTRRYPFVLSIYSVARPSREAKHRAHLRRRVRLWANPRFAVVGNPQGKVGASRDQAKAFRGGGGVWELSAALRFLVVDPRSAADLPVPWPVVTAYFNAGMMYLNQFAMYSCSRSTSRGRKWTSVAPVGRSPASAPPCGVFPSSAGMEVGRIRLCGSI